jgi:hypothetical protein
MNIVEYGSLRDGKQRVLDWIMGFIGASITITYNSLQSATA